MAVGFSPTSPALAASAQSALAPDERLALDLALIAKGVCSAVFIAGRSLEDTLAQSVRAQTAEGAPVVLEIDGAARRVSASFAGARRTALMAGDQGAIILPLGARAPLFTPRAARSCGMDPWPNASGDARANAALAAAFAQEPDTLTAAALIVHRGELLGERYGEGVTARTPLESWSIGKTFVAALIGVAAHRGLLQLDDPLDLAEWRIDRADPRRAITFRHALQMSSGLGFSAAWAEDYDAQRDGYPDHALIYSGAVDSRALAASRPLAHAPGAFGAYKNGDTLILMAALEDRLLARGLDPLRWPYEALAAPIGMRDLWIETDPYGRYLPCGYVHASARDWACLASLLLNDGICAGVRLLPEGYVAQITAPAPAWRGKYWMGQAPQGFAGSIYGGHVFLNRQAPSDRWPLPEDAFFMLGIGGQYVFACPSLDLIAVRMGHVRGAEAGAGRGHAPAFIQASAALARSI